MLAIASGNMDASLALLAALPDDYINVSNIKGEVMHRTNRFFVGARTPPLTARLDLLFIAHHRRRCTWRP